MIGLLATLFCRKERKKFHSTQERRTLCQRYPPSTEKIVGEIWILLQIQIAPRAVQRQSSPLQRVSTAASVPRCSYSGVLAEWLRRATSEECRLADAVSTAEDADAKGRF